MPAAELEAMRPADVAELIRAHEERERRLDYRTGILCSIIANANRDPKRCPQPFEPADFFASLESDPPDPEDLWNGLLAWAGDTGA